jgi:hypothetical protein
MLIGAGLLGFGIYQNKTYYGDQHFSEAEVVGYERYEGGRGLQGAAFTAIGSLAGAVYPIVDIRLPSGALRSVKLNTLITNPVIAQHPEFQIGGKVSVTYFGTDPRTVYLTNHPLAQTVMKTSAFLLVGIALLGLGVIMIAASIWFANTL